MNTSGSPVGRARVSLSKTRAAYIGPGLDLAPHRNVAATVAFALQAPFELRFPGEGAPGPARGPVSAALIPPGAWHHLRPSGEMVFIYLDALSDDYEQFRRRDLEAAHARLGRVCREAGWAPDVDGLCDLLGVPARRIGDTRIADVVRRLDESPQDFGRISDAARLAGVSVSRFQALFRQSVGVPFRPYRLWRRMAVVMRAVSAGETLTAAALDAGFSSSAHLSVTFRTMFGVTPSSLMALGARIEFARPERRA